MRKGLLTLLACCIFLYNNTHAQIIISQYYEGNSTNKWIELTNLGSSSVNTALPQLRLGIWSVGGSTGNIAFTGSPSATVNLNVTIPAKGSVLIGNTGNGSEVSYLTSSSSAAQTSNTVINFNGNDGIALLNSNNTIIDCFGTGINAADISYTRNTSVTATSSTFISSQWASVTLTNVNSAGTTSANRLGIYSTTTGGGTIGSGEPIGYYNTANSLSCQDLKTALKNITKNTFTSLSYTPGVWNIYKYSDIRRNDANTADVIWDMYSDNPSGTDPYTFTLSTNQCGTYTNEGDCYNREHSTPQSWFNSASPMVSDAHHIFATDGKVNALRSNYPFGEVTSATSTSRNGSKLGTGNNNFGYTGIVFEPIDAYKGDFARACLYMAVRYEDEIITQNWSSLGTGNAVFLSSTDQSDAARRRLFVYDLWFLQLVIKWHKNDPVSTKEINRNNAIFTQQVVNNSSGTLAKQGNRNPFIDHPEYVEAIWGTGTGINCSATSTNVVVDNKTPFDNDVVAVETFKIYPNPAKDVVTIVTPTKLTSITIIDVYGKAVKTIVYNYNTTLTQRIDVSDLANGIYFIKLNTPTHNVVQRLIKQ
jgi:endonuclease I